MDKINIIQQLDQKNYVWFAVGTFLKRPIFLIFLLAAVYGGKEIFTQIIAGEFPDSPFLGLIIGYFVLLLVYGLAAKSTFEQNPFFHQENQLQISESGIRIETEGAMMEFAWDQVVRVREFRNWISIQVTRANAILIYRPDLEDESNWEILKSIVRGQPGLQQKLRK
ncbi:YcxB family protein [Pontibacter sp. G13]|uniref:YcxB family protein n=1 Tax=Pontibacter sp. G13 TaxID=3074898 RepID=UPI002889A2B9|nr:YcxB family protein [Pontibacter sp. G13]WNJ16875.1 YcxB family protein [Pontibacter sp. G13]